MLLRFSRRTFERLRKNFAKNFAKNFNKKIYDLLTFMLTRADERRNGANRVSRFCLLVKKRTRMAQARLVGW